MIDLFKQSSSRTSHVVASAVSLTTLCMYVNTLSRTVGSFDVADSQVTAATLGISHQTGYPLWTLLGYAWTHVPLGTDPAYMMNLLTAILAAATAGLLVVFAMRLGVGWVPAAAGGLVWAFSTETWLRLTQAEGQSLHTFLAVLLLLLWAKAEEGDSKSAIGMFFVIGLGLAHHRLMVVVALPLLLWFFTRHWSMARKPVFLLKAGVAATAPLLLYAYLPLRAGAYPTIVNADMSRGTMAVIRGDAVAQNSTYLTIDSPAALWRGLHGFSVLIGHSVGLAAGMLALLGVFVMLFRARRYVIGFALIFTAMVYVEGDPVGAQSRHFLVPIAFAAIAAAFGVDGLLGIARSFRSGRSPLSDRLIAVATLLIVAALPASVAAANYPKANRSSDYTDELTALNILGSAPRGAVIWSYWDVRTTLEYLHYVKNVRPDVVIPDHRAYARYGCSGCEAVGDPVVARGLALDPQFQGRPIFFCTVYEPAVNRGGPAVRFTLVREFSGAFGFDRAPASLYLVERR